MLIRALPARPRFPGLPPRTLAALTQGARLPCIFFVPLAHVGFDVGLFCVAEPRRKKTPRGQNGIVPPYVIEAGTRKFPVISHGVAVRKINVHAVRRRGATRTLLCVKELAFQ